MGQTFNPTRQELTYRLQYLIGLRWAAVAAIALAPDAVRLITGIRVSRPAFWLTAAGLLLFNLGCLSYHRRTLAPEQDPDARNRAAVPFSVIQSVADFAALTILLHVSGGVSNPFSSYYIFHVIISAILLPRAVCFLVTGGGAVMVGAELLAHHTGLWTRPNPAGFADWFGGPPVATTDLLSAAVLVSSMGVAAALATAIMAQVGRRTAEIERLRDDLEQQNEQLQQLGRLKNRFLSIASHDLKSPLAAVEGYLKIFLDDTLDPSSEQGKEWLKRCALRLQGMRRLVTDLLDITRIESGQLLTRKTDVDLTAVAEDVCETFQPAAEAAGLTLTLETLDHRPVVKGDPDRLRQVLDNLVSNAMKFTAEGGVTVCIKRTDGEPGEVMVEVADTGKGISEEDLKRVFDDFFRAKGVKKSEGTGLGLAIAARLVEAHGGRINARSTPGKGSVFTVHLPVAASPGPIRQPGPVR